MTDFEYLDEPIQITGSMKRNGEINLHHIDWRNQTYTIVSIGRQWEDEQGRFILVETANGSRFEVMLSRDSLTWRIRKHWQPLAMA